MHKSIHFWAWAPLLVLGACGGGTDQPETVQGQGTDGRAQAQAVVTVGGIVNGDFEAPVLPAGTYVYQPKNVNGWTFSASAVLTSTGSAFSLGAPLFGTSKQVVALQDYGKIQQTLEIAPGDEIWFRAMQRQNVRSNGSMAVLVDGEPQMVDELSGRTSIAPSRFGWNLYRVKLSPPGAGSHQVTLRGVSGGDVAILLDDVRLVRAAEIAQATEVAVANGSFETPGLVAGQYLYRPDGSGWTWTGAAAISSNGSAFSKPLGLTSANRFVSAVDGAQVGVLQMNASVAAPMALQPGDELVFDLTPRQYYYDFLVDPATFNLLPDQVLTVRVNGHEMMVPAPEVSLQWLPGEWATVRVPLTEVVEAGTHVVEVATVLASPYPDKSYFIDNVRIRRLQSPQ